jgi:hypothetical protein
MLAALTVMFWVKEEASNASGNTVSKFNYTEISKQLVDALRRPKANRGAEGMLQRYSELTALYSQAHNATVRLLKLASIHFYYLCYSLP